MEATNVYDKSYCDHIKDFQAFHPELYPMQNNVKYMCRPGFICSSNVFQYIVSRSVERRAIALICSSLGG